MTGDSLAPDLSGDAKCDVTLSMRVTSAGDIRGAIEYNRDLFERATVERMAARLSVLDLDLASQDSVEAFAAALRERHGGRVDLLLNVAGILHDAEYSESGLGAQILSALRLTQFTAAISRCNLDDKMLEACAAFLLRHGLQLTALELAQELQLPHVPVQLVCTSDTENWRTDDDDLLN